MHFLCSALPPSIIVGGSWDEVGCATLNGISVASDEEIGPYTNIGSFQSRRTAGGLRFFNAVFRGGN